MHSGETGRAVSIWQQRTRLFQQQMQLTHPLQDWLCDTAQLILQHFERFLHTTVSRAQQPARTPEEPAAAPSRHLLQLSAAVSTPQQQLLKDLLHPPVTQPQAGYLPVWLLACSRKCTPLVLLDSSTVASTACRELLQLPANQGANSATAPHRAAAAVASGSSQSIRSSARAPGAASVSSNSPNHLTPCSATAEATAAGSSSSLSSTRAARPLTASVG